MQAKKKNSVVVSDDMWDEAAEEYEKGTWFGHGEISAGRPKLYNEEMATVSFRLPVSRIAAIEAVVEARGESLP